MILVTDTNNTKRALDDIIKVINGMLDSSNIRENAILDKNILDGSITTDKVSDANITPEKLSDFGSCRLIKTAAQTLSNSAAPLDKITWDTEQYDTLNWHSTSSNTDRVTITSDGSYIIMTTISFTANATGSRGVSIMVNGSEIAYSRIPATSNANQYVNCATSKTLSANDYIQIGAFQNSGGNLDTVANQTAMFLSVIRVR